MNEENKYSAYGEIIKRILEGEGKASAEARQAAFDNSGLTEPLSTFVNKVALHPAKITDEDIREIVSSGFDEDKIFELIICAAVGQAARQYESALKALSEATDEAERQGDAT